MFEMTNYKTAPYSAGNIWAAKHSLNLLNKNRSSWFEDDVTASSEFACLSHSDMATSASALLRLCSHSAYASLSAYRFLSAITRGPVDLKLHGWVLVTVNSKSFACYVSEMAQLVLAESSVLRLRLTECRKISMSQHDLDTAGMVGSSSILIAKKSEQGRVMMVRLESCAVVGLNCEDCGDHYQYRYVW
jgi:hypothetical protein